MFVVKFWSVSKFIAVFHFCFHVVKICFLDLSRDDCESPGGLHSGTTETPFRADEANFDSPTASVVFNAAHLSDRRRMDISVASLDHYNVESSVTG